MIEPLMEWSGINLEIDGFPIALSDPCILPVASGTCLYSRIVVIRNALTEDEFLQAARRQLDRMGVGGCTLSIPRTQGGFPRRRFLKVKGVKIVGYCLQIDGLAPDDARKLLMAGLGGSRRMGCGLFFSPKSSDHQATEGSRISEATATSS
jgi:CRISPR-associated endonuclease/helicase Cas3